MAGTMRLSRKSLFLAAAAAISTVLVPLPALAQSSNTAARLDRIEQEIQALQRKVFPGGDKRFFKPEITPQASPTPSARPAAPSPSAMTNVLTRLDAIETQLAQLTAATEVNKHALNGLDARVSKLEAQMKQPTGLLPVPGGNQGTQTAGNAGAGQAPNGELPAVAQSGSQQQAPAQQQQAQQQQAQQRPKAPPKPVGPSPERLARVKAVIKPSTKDPAEDDYIYGYRLWKAGLYPEAEQQLAMFLKKYPTSWRATYARNLLGRAYLDAGDPRTAAKYFFDNYEADKHAARAPDSLLYLAQSMIALGDTNRACIALAEFGDSYQALATGRLQQQYNADRGRVDCSK